MSSTLPIPIKKSSRGHHWADSRVVENPGDGWHLDSLPRFRIKRIDDPSSGIFHVDNIACGERQVVDFGGGGQETINDRQGSRRVHPSPLVSNHLINRQDVSAEPFADIL